MAEAMAGFAGRYYKGTDTPTVVALYVKKCVVWSTLERGGKIAIQAHVEGIEDPKGYTVSSEYRRKAKGRFILKSEETIS